MYHYSADSIIDEIRLIPTGKGGGARAYLHASSNASPEQLEQVRSKLAARGWISIPDVLDGRPVLEVRGFKKPFNLLQELTGNGSVKGAGQTTQPQGDKITLRERLSNWTLTACGLIYWIGDLGYTGYAILDHRQMPSLPHKINIGAGIGYFLGSASLVFYGNRDQSDTQIRNATREMLNFLNKESVKIPANAPAREAAKESQRNLFGHINHFLSRFPSEVINTIYIFVGFAISYSNYRSFREAKAAGKVVNGLSRWLDVGLGSVTTLSALGAVAIKEKKRPEGEPRKKGLAGVWEWIQEKPLRLSGYGYMVATGFHIASTTNELRKNIPADRNKLLLRGLFAVTNVVAEGLMAISSKGHGAGIVSRKGGVDDAVLATAADIIANQKPADQPGLIQRLSGFLSSPELLNLKSADIEVSLRQKVEAMQNHPWRRKAVDAQPQEAPAAPQTTGPQSMVSMAQLQQRQAQPELAVRPAIG